MSKQREGMSWKSISDEITTSGEALSASAPPPPEPQGQCERSRLATGSLPVSSAEALIRDLESCVRAYERWRMDAEHKGQLDWKARYQNVIDAYNHCIAGLRRQVVAATVRQPEENTKVSHGA